MHHRDRLPASARGVECLAAEVGAYPTRNGAELAQAALAAAGILSVLAADDAGGAYPFDLSGAARLLVDEADAEQAATVISQSLDATAKE
jgi:hypothetical protein